jgi:hypothetical protein
MAKKDGDIVVRLLERFLMPIVATAASAAASYVAERAPQFLGAGAHPAPHPGPGSNGRRRISADEFDRRRDQRAQGRANRRKAVR